MTQITQQDFISRADLVTQRQLSHINTATSALNAIMASLTQKTGVTVPDINPLIPEAEPSQVNFIPTADVVAIFKDDYTGRFSELKDWFAGLKADAITSFFPYINNPIGDLSDEWVARALSGEVINLSEDAELSRGRSRARAEALRARRSSADAYAALGYPLPGGALIYVQHEVDFQAGQTVAALNRDITIRSQELKADMAKFAVTQITQLRSVAAQGLTSYLNVFATLPTTALSYAAQKAKVQDDLWVAGSRYYEGQLRFKGLMTETGKANQQGEIAAAQMETQVAMEEIKRSLSALQTAAEVYGRLVAGAMAGVNSHISLNASNSASDSYTHNLTS